MIQVRRLNGKVFYLNHNLIETIEDTPDTVVKLTNGVKYVVRDGASVLNERIIAFNRQIFADEHTVRGYSPRTAPGNIAKLKSNAPLSCDHQKAPRHDK